MLVVVALGFDLFTCGFRGGLVVLKDYLVDVLGDFWEGVCDLVRGIWEWIKLSDYVFRLVVAVLGIVGMVLMVVGRV